jgi:hypothetical protein
VKTTSLEFDFAAGGGGLAGQKAGACLIDLRGIDGGRGNPKEPVTFALSTQG